LATSPFLTVASVVLSLMWTVTMSPTAAVSVICPLRLIMAALRAPGLSATSGRERSWIIAGVFLGGFGCGGWRASGGRGRRHGARAGGLRGDGGCHVRLGDGLGGRAHGALDDGDDAPALQAAQGAGLHDLDLVAHLGLVLLIVGMHDGLSVDNLVVERVRGLVGDGYLDGLVARAARDKAQEGLALVAGFGRGGGHGVGCGCVPLGI